ncbi:hypothetical protein Xmir_01258 [Xenorhabdus miraniensis]|uniref:Uncharacterized protein n=1 Tax=Xenorhabdus miraniensis TaxID=351674 RepID=A0A2D0JSR0_9GAMM|nr:hypothetical protein Xmir_01258 [Xenorhabdus miraniensis]
MTWLGELPEYCVIADAGMAFFASSTVPAKPRFFTNSFLFGMSAPFSRLDSLLLAFSLISVTSFWLAAILLLLPVLSVSVMPLETMAFIATAN